MVAARALLRTEWRQVRRNPWRSLLIVLLVAVPVGGIVGGATLARLTQPSATDRGVQAMGSAALRVEGEDLRAAASKLPKRALSARVFAGLEQVSTPGRKLRARLLAASPDAVSGLAAGMVELVEGRPPVNSGEVALSPSLLDGLGKARGDAVTLEYGASRTITGVVIDPEDLEVPLVLRTQAHVEHAGKHALLVGDLGSEETPTIASLRAGGYSVETRAEAETADPAMAFFVFALGFIGLFEAALVISAAFAIGVRRRQVDIGLLGSVGAGVGRVALSLIGSAVGLAAIGAAGGAVAAIGVVASIHPWLDGWTNRLTPPFSVAPGDVVLAVVLGVVTAAVAATVPAATAARLSIRDALAGTRPAKRRARSWCVVGTICVAAGVLFLVWAKTGGGVAKAGVVLGPLLGVLGFGIASPWLLDAVSRIAGRLPLAWRLAVRDAGRFRERNGAVVTAVLAGMAMSVTVAVMVQSFETSFEAFPKILRDDQLLVEGPGAEETAGRIVTELSATAATPLVAAYLRGDPVRARFDGDSTLGRSDWVAVGDDRLVHALGASGHAAGALLVLDPPESYSSVELTTWVGGQPLASLELSPSVTGQRLREPAFALDPATAEARGYTLGPPPNRSLAPWLVRFDSPIDAQRLEAAREIAGESVRTTVDAARLRVSPFRGFYLAVLAACGLTGLLIVLVSTALSAAESANDERILHTVGAAPHLLWRHLAARAGYVAWLGCVLAVPAGLMVAAALFEAANFPLTVLVPWGQMILIVLGLPALVFATTWLYAMTRRSGFAVAALVVLAVPSVSAAERFVGDAFDGSPLAGELHRVRSDDGIDLAFVRFRTTHPSPGPPIFFLAGGPGGSGIDGAALVATHPQIRLLEHADVIGIDQRGTGLSGPALTRTVETETLRRDVVIDREAWVDALKRAAERTARYWKVRGVDLADYTTAASASDVETVRRAVGADRVVLYGSSYGSHLALAYMRAHPDRVARAVLRGVEGPNHTWKLPSTVQGQLEKLPDPGAVRRLLDRLGREQVVAGDVALGPFDLQVFVAQSLDSVDRLERLPAMLKRMEGGDWSDLAAWARENRTAGVHALALAMDCASGGSSERLARLERERRDPRNVLADAILWPIYPEACPNAAADVGDGFRGPLELSAPTLFVSGTLDVRTPPGNVMELRDGFARGVHVIVENAAHDSRELMSPEFRGLLQGFLRGEEIEDCRVTLPGPMYEP